MCLLRGAPAALGGIDPRIQVLCAAAHGAGLRGTTNLAVMQHVTVVGNHTPHFIIIMLGILTGCGSGTATPPARPTVPMEHGWLALRVPMPSHVQGQCPGAWPGTRGWSSGGQESPAAHAMQVNVPGSSKLVQVAGRGPLIGYVYRIEGYLNGQPVVYVGSAGSIKERLTATGGKHDWRQLLVQKNTVVYAKKVYGTLDIAASHQKTPGSALNEALRSMEEPMLEQAEKRAERENRNRAPGQKRKVIGNKIRASNTPDLWRARHKVSMDRRWRQVKGPGTGFKLGAMNVGFLLLEVYKMYCDAKKSRYIMAPYVLEDEHGAFVLHYRKGILNGLFSTTYFKHYVLGDYQGRYIEVDDSEWQLLREEAEALWGMLDESGDFVPGLLQPELRVMTPHAHLLPEAHPDRQP